MSETPYSTAVRRHNTHVKKWPEMWQKGVQVLAVNKAQGNQADVVFVDMARTTKPGFMDNTQGLNVAITKAQQAEIVVMHQLMTM